MSLTGRTISRYRIAEKIGQGGMGEVYRATDTKLKRDVALKMLSAEKREDAEACRRFAREALTAAALDHPFICKIYEVVEGREGGVIAMEFVEGTSLKQSLEKRSPSIQEAVRIAIEITEALEAAHDKGIIHRDLKPSNIMLTRRGHVKVMDFGLAKTFVVSKAGPESNTVDSVSGRMLVGSVGYMSPEQARGQELDQRTDLFSLGVVLYEMLTGRLPFARSTPADSLNALLNGELVPARELNPKIPIELARVLERLLAREPSRRYHAARNLLLDLNTTARRSIPQVSRARSRQSLAKLCICGRSSRYPLCDNSHVDEGWSCSESPTMATVGFSTSNRYLNLAQKLASHYHGTVCLAADPALSLHRLVTIVDGTDLELPAQLHRQIEAKERIVFTLGVPPRLLSGFFPGSHLVDLSDTDPAHAFQAVAAVLDRDIGSEVSSEEPPILRSAFVSHAVRDEALLIPVKEYLEEFFGADLFLCADSISPGSSWQDRIVAALRAKDLFVQLVSRSSLESQFCSFEAGMASALEKPIRTISLDGSRPPLFLQHLHVVDLNRLKQRKPWLETRDLLSDALLQILL